MSHAKRKKLRASAVAAAGAVAVAGATVATSWAGIAHAATVQPAASHMTGMAGMTSMPALHQPAYNFTTLDNANDLTFNQLLGINNHGVIAGYFGSGAAGQPNKGYQLFPPFRQGDYVNENFPHSVQTQVTGINDKGDTVGFWSSMNNANQVNDNHGFYKLRGRGFRTADFPTGSPAAPPVDQLLGINNSDVAVGFYADANGNNHGYTYNIKHNRYAVVTDPSAPTASLTAAAINSGGDIAGFYTNPATGNTDGFLKYHGKFTDLAYPGASATTALGVNDRDEVVGAYTVGSGSTAVMHGFTWTPRGGFVTVDDPNGAGTTTINGVNDEGDLVGFYTDSAGNTDGFAAAPVNHTIKVHVNLASMPEGTVGISNGAIQVNAWGLTPGSAHVVALLENDQLTVLGSLTADGTGDVTDASFSVGHVPGGSRVVILDGDQTTSVIAQTYKVGRGGRYGLHAVEAGFPQGSLRGHATLVYNPGAQTITVTLWASGLTPGAHAAHIHVGSCQSQGPVAYMLMDFHADHHGNINHQTRTVTGVTAVELSGGWYLNLHQGNSNNIVSNGQPTINFRPLLCANI